MVTGEGATVVAIGIVTGRSRPPSRRGAEQFRLWRRGSRRRNAHRQCEHRVRGCDAGVLASGMGCNEGRSDGRPSGGVATSSFACGPQLFRSGRSSCRELIRRDRWAVREHAISPWDALGWKQMNSRRSIGWTGFSRLRTRMLVGTRRNVWSAPDFPYTPVISRRILRHVQCSSLSR
jgi:hypothetical protein